MIETLLLNHTARARIAWTARGWYRY